MPSATPFLTSPDPAQPALTGTLISVCAYCGDEYGRKPCIPAMDGALSHGICAACTPGVIEAALRGENFSAARKTRENPACRGGGKVQP